MLSLLCYFLVSLDSIIILSPTVFHYKLQKVIDFRPESISFLAFSAPFVQHHQCFTELIVVILYLIQLLKS